MNIFPKKDFVDNIPRKDWSVLPTLDLYILKEFMIPFTVLIMGFMLLFLLGDIFNDLKDFLTDQSVATVPDIIKFFLLLMPGNIRFVLPISMLLACMYTMANFGRNMEVTAMRASGISLMRCGGSIYMVGLIVTCVNFYFNEHFVPTCQRDSEILKKTLTNPNFKKEFLSMLTFVSNNKERTWLFNSFDVDGLQKDVILKKFKKNRTLEWDIQAKEAVFIPGKGWEFRKVTLTPYGITGFMPGNPEKFEVLHKTVDEIPETPEEIHNAVKPPEDLPSLTILKIITSTKNMAQSCKNTYYTILFERMAFPWSCFLAVFLGIPLAGKNERSGIFKAVILAVVVIVVYQMTSNIFVILGKQGILNPAIAGLSPTVGFLVYGWYNIMRQT
jgi:lipopolysaccharide export system permease protein